MVYEIDNVAQALSANPNCTPDDGAGAGVRIGYSTDLERAWPSWSHVGLYNRALTSPEKSKMRAYARLHGVA